MTKKNTDFNFVTSLDPFGINPGRFSAIAISSNGLIAAASYPQSLVGVWNWKSGNKSFVLFQKVRDLGFSPDGLVLVTQSYHRELKFWNTSDATLIAVVENAQPFRFHSFSPDGRYFACSREESTAILDVESGRTIASFKRTKLPSNTKLASKGEFLVQTFANEVIVDPISESSNIKGVTLTCGDRVKSIAISHGAGKVLEKNKTSTISTVLYCR